MAKKKGRALDFYLGIFLSLGLIATYCGFQMVAQSTFDVDDTVAAVVRVETGCAVAFDEFPYLAIGTSKGRICEVAVGQRVQVELTVNSTSTIYGFPNEATLSVDD